MNLVLLIIVSAIAFRGACSVSFYASRGDGVLENPQWTTTPQGKRFVRLYVYAAIPIACLNGLLLHGFIGLLLSGIGTWIGMLAVNLFLRFNAGNQFMIFGSINIIWTLVNVL